MEWKEARGTLIVGLFVLLVGIAGGLASVTINILGQINLNIQELNSKIAVVINRQESTTLTLIDHENRIRELEKKHNRN